MAILFAVWTYYQYNDVDPVIWMIVYGITCILSLFFAFNRISYWVFVTWAVICLVWAGWLAPQIEYVGNLILIELWREMVGLIIIGLWSSIAAYWLFKRNKSAIAEAT